MSKAALAAPDAWSEWLSAHPTHESAASYHREMSAKGRSAVQGAAARLHDDAIADPSKADAAWAESRRLVEMRAPMRIENEWDALAEPVSITGPVSAPEGLTRGKPVQLLRVGPVYDRRTGDKVVDITDALMMALADNTRAAGEPVVLDWNHGSVFGKTADEARSYGEIDLATIMVVPGRGMWAQPLYNAEGASLVGGAGGVLFTSPEMMSAHDVSTGETRGLRLRAVALTNRPRQDRLERVRLSEDNEASAQVCVSRDPTTHPGSTRTTEESMAASQGTPAPEPGNGATAPEEGVIALAEHNALKDEHATLLSEHDALKAEVDALKEKAEAAVSLSEQVSEANKAKAEAEETVVKLSERIDALETARYAERKDVVIGKARDAGHIAGENIALAERLYDAQHRAGVEGVFDGFIADKAKRPDVQLGEVGHAGKGPEPAADPAQAMTLKLSEVQAKARAEGQDVNAVTRAWIAENAEALASLEVQ